MSKKRTSNEVESSSAKPFIIGYILLILTMFAIFVMIVLAMVGVIGV